MYFVNYSQCLHCVCICVFQSVLLYDIIGEDDAVTHFRIDQDTGLITLALPILNTGRDAYVVSAAYMLTIIGTVKTRKTEI